MKAIVLGFVLTAALTAEGWRAGVGRVDISPAEPIWMAGYAARTRPSDGVEQRIWAKALALDDGSGKIAVMVTSDLLGWTRGMSREVAARAERQYGLSRDRLILNASHTHSGPVTGQLLRPAYPIPKDQVPAVERYTAKLLDQVTGLVGAAIGDLQPATLHFEQGFAGFAVNRRRVGHREYPSVVDHDVPVLAVRSPDGRLRAAVFGYACHATVLMEQRISGDWPGYAQEAFERANPGATGLFLNGCGADANPLPRRTLALAKQYGEILNSAVGQVLDQKMKPVAGPLRTAYREEELALQPAPPKEEFEKRRAASDALGARHAELMLERLARDGKLEDRYPFPAQVWRFGGSLKLIALGGEVVADYAIRFKRQYGPDDTWVAGYSNDVFAYIPSLRVLREGGYEGGGAMIPYGLPAPFTESVETKISELVDTLMHQTR